MRVLGAVLDDGAGVGDGLRAAEAGALAGFGGALLAASAASRDASAARVAAGSGSNFRDGWPVAGACPELVDEVVVRARARAEPGIGRRGSSRSWMTGATIRMTSSSLAEASGSRRTP